MSLDALAEAIGMDKGNLSRVERGLSPYHQEMLENIAIALNTDLVSLISRRPEDGRGLHALLDEATAQEREQLVTIARALIDARRSPPRH